MQSCNHGLLFSVLRPPSSVLRLDKLDEHALLHCPQSDIRVGLRDKSHSRFVVGPVMGSVYFRSLYASERILSHGHHYI